MATRLGFAAVATIALAACEDPSRTLAPDGVEVTQRASRHSDYTVTDLGTLGGSYSYAEGLNQQGVVVGVSETSAGAMHAFVWTPGAAGGSGNMQDLGTLAGWDYSAALGINNHGDIVGYVYNEAGTLSRPVRWNRQGSGYAIEQLQHLGGHKGGGQAINNQGDVAGISCPVDLKSHSMIWSRKGNRNLGTNGGISLIASDINDHGQIVATRDPGAHFSIGYVWSEEDGFRDIGHLGGTGPEDGTIADAINNQGQVTGITTTVEGLGAAFIWSEEGGMEDLGTLGGRDAMGLDINEAGEIVGVSETGDGGYHAFIWSRGLGMRDLGGLADGGFRQASGITGGGLISGGSQTGDGHFHAVLWTPRTSE